MPDCGAKTRSGAPCQKAAMANGRCKLHGGMSTGAPKGNQNARKHGFYSCAVTHEESEIWDTIKVGSLDEEIKLAKTQLRRLLIAQQQNGDGLELDSVEEIGVVDDQKKRKATKNIKKRRVPFEDLIYRTLGRIGDLETRRMDMLRNPIKDDGDEAPVAVTVTIKDASEPDA